MSGYLQKSGGTMTGPLTLSGDPTSNLHASTKEYVDDEVADSIPQVLYGKLDSTSTNTVMTAQIQGITELKHGTTIMLKNGVVTSADGVTLNINGLGAKPIYSSMAATTSVKTVFNINYTMLFTYDTERLSTGCWIMHYGYYANTTYSNASLGQGYATCSTAEATVAKTASLSSYSLTTGGYVSVKFTYAVPASATLNVNSKGAKAMYYRGAAITAGIIKAGDLAVFLYNGSQYHLVAIDRNTQLGSLAYKSEVAKTDLASGVQASLDLADSALQSYTETDPTVPSWAKQSAKPTYTAAEVGALPDSTVIPSKTSDLTNDSGFITSADVPEGAAASTTTPKMDGTAATGSETAFARGDHRHPTDTSRAAASHSHAITDITNLQTTLDGKADNADIPTKTSDLTNDSGFLTSHQDISGKLNANGDGSSVTVTFTTASSRVNIATGGTLATAFSRIAKWLSDLGSLAFKSSATYSDLDSGVQASLNLADTALQSYTETDPTVPSWAKASSKPTYTYSEVGAAASSHTHSIANVTNLQSSLDAKENASTVVTATLLASGWSNGSYAGLQTTYPYASYDISVALNGDSCTTAHQSAWSRAKMVGSPTTNVIKALGTVPTADIPVMIKVVSK